MDTNEDENKLWEKIKVFFKLDLWVFLRYIFLCPFYSVRYYWSRVNRTVHKLDYPRGWITLSSILMIIAFLFGQLNIAKVFAVILIISFLAHEWIAGEWKHDWRESYKRRGGRE